MTPPPIAVTPLISEFALKPAVKFYQIYTEQVMEFSVLIRYVTKLTNSMLVIFKKNPTDEDKLFQSPRKPSKDYSKALLELKGYLRFLLLDKDINTGREMIEIKQAINGYLYPTMKEILKNRQTEHKVFMSTVDISKQNERVHSKDKSRKEEIEIMGPDEDTEYFNN